MKTRLIIFGINRNIRISLAVSLVPLTLLSLFFQSEGIPQISDGEWKMAVNISTEFM